MRAALLAVLAGCVSAGGENVRADFAARVQTAQPAIAQCYQTALARQPAAQGMIVVAFAAAPSSGQFVDFVVQRDDIRDQAMGQCVLDALAQQRLAAPLTSRTTTTLPIHFAPQ